MNWTGGRLRRHSSNSKNATLTKVQKQNFAKFKARASKAINHELLPPFQYLTQFAHFRNDPVPPDQRACDVGGGGTRASTQQVRNMLATLNIIYSADY